MNIRSKIGTTTLALILAVGGGSVAFSGSQRGHDPTKSDEDSGHTRSLKDSGFVGTWTGPILQRGQSLGTFVSVIAADGSGTVDLPELKCSGTHTLVSFDGTVLKLQLTLTSNVAANCVGGGVSTITLTGPNTSTWTFLSPTGDTANGTGTRTVTPRIDRELLAKFAGVWTGPPPADFTATLAKDGNGTIVFPTVHCSGTLSFVSFDGTILKLRMTITPTPGVQCPIDGVASATLPVGDSSTWTFVSDAGGTTSGVATRTAKVHVDHSCDNADQKVAKIAEHQSGLASDIAELNSQLAMLNALKAKAIAAGNAKVVVKLDKRIGRIQSKIDQKTTASAKDIEHQNVVEDRCGINPTA